MDGPRRSARKALLLLVGVLAGPAPPVLWAQPFPVLGSPESPPADAPAAQPFAPVQPAPADPPTPTVSLHVRAPASAAVGQEVDYRIFVENPSRAAAHHVVVRAPAAANAAFVRASPEPSAKEPQMMWELGTLGPGTSKEILLTLKPSGAGDVDVIARVQFEHGQSVRTRIGAATPPAAAPAAAATPLPTGLMPPAAPIPPAAPPPPAGGPAKPALRLTKAGPAQALQYDIITFRLEVTNTGTADAADVELTDSVPPGLRYQPRGDSDPTGNLLTWNLGKLAPGQTRRIEYQANALETGDQENKAQVTAAGGLRETASWRVRVNEPKLTVAVSGPQKRLLNRPAKYQITVANLGQTRLTGVEATAKLPAGVRVVSASDNGRQEGDAVHWILGEAPAGGRRTVTVELSAAAEAEALLRVAVKADRGITATAEAKTLFVGAAGLHVDIDKGEDPLPVGREAEYTIRVFNGGTAAARNIRVTLTAPEQMQATAKEGPAEGTTTGNTVAFAPLAALAPGKDATYRVRLRALKAGEVKVVVEVKSDDLATPLHEEETTTLFDAVPAVMPPAAPDAPAGPPVPAADAPPPLPGPP